MDSKGVVMGIFGQCDQLPADSSGIHKALHRLKHLYPEFFKDCKFDENGFSSRIDSDINEMLFEGLMGFTGNKLEIFEVSDKLKTKFSTDMSHKFTEQQLKTIQVMGAIFPTFLKKNESARYHRLVNTEEVV